MTEKIIIAGAGGQGIMLLGKILAETAMREDKFTTWLPAYGAEVRGGTAFCMVIISDSEIGSPYIEKADSLIIMNEPSLKKFKSRVRKNGLLLLNSSLIKDNPGADNNILSFPFSGIASELGSLKVANVVALGCFSARNKIVDAKTILEAIEGMAPEGRKELIEINKKAFAAGRRLIRTEC
ncbi:MAG: 2-oxoacid:acceptor oxidoreductase family protein [Candidatus Omnitrophica bacterium]|nr:2-oxoacid:acceptor oxidoreductase family protein [Candidatus Omnitrophota bacterium]